MIPVRSTGSIKKESSLVSFFNRKGKLYVQFEANGKRYQRSTRLEDTPKNRALVKKEVVPRLQQKILSGQFESERTKVKTFAFYAEKHKALKDGLKTYNALRGTIDNRLLPVFGNKKVDTIRRADVKEFADTLLQSVSPKRAKSIINILAAILDIAVDYEHIVTNPAKNIKLPKHEGIRKIQPFSKEEVQTILANAEDWFKNIVATAFYTGMRQGEIIALTWDDIDFERKTITVNKRIKKGVISTPKTKSSIRIVPMLDILIPYLKNQYELCKEINCSSVFFNPRTNKQFFDTGKLLPYWYETLEKANVEKRVFYNTRHTFITLMLRSGQVPMLDIAQIVGHKNIEEIIQTYARYLPNEHLKLNRSLSVFTDNSADKAG